MKVEATEVDGRKVYSVRGFNNGIARWLNKLPTLWIEGECLDRVDLVARRQDALNLGENALRALEMLEDVSAQGEFDVP